MRLLWFDFFAVLVFVIVVVISIKIAFSQLSVRYILLWFDFFAVLVFVMAVVISIKIVFLQLSVGYILPSMRLVRGKLRQSWSCMAVAWMKPIVALLADDKERGRILGSPPVTWTIGSKPKLERSKIVREGVQVYTNGDVYEGEFHQGKSFGSEVYYYYMSERYKGDWVDGKYDGYDVETWAWGSHYRGQYREGLRHGYSMYRFYTGDVYAGEWCNGQSHGYGAHTCEDGSRYVGEFKWGVKHGLGYYHFRNGNPILESILQIKCMGLVFTILPMALDMKVHGMKEESRALECIYSQIRGEEFSSLKPINKVRERAI